jgi:hypothetical protein
MRGVDWQDSPQEHRLSESARFWPTSNSVLNRFCRCACEANVSAIFIKVFLAVSDSYQHQCCDQKKMVKRAFA